MQIAIDGPAGAGKSTVAKAVAAALHYKYLDTGAMYRALAVALAQAGIDTRDGAAVLAALPDFPVEVTYSGDEQHVSVNGRDLSSAIRSAEAALGASDVAALPEVRSRLVEQQQQAARNYDVVMDGRDIGTYVLPQADYKFYLTASPRARAERRRRDLLALGQNVDVETLVKEIQVRDKQDMTRAVAPLSRTPDQVLIDTTDMSEQEAVQKMLAVIRGQA